MPSHSQTAKNIAEPGQLSAEDQSFFRTLQFRLMTILPEQYQDNYEEVKPVSMGSAGLKFGSDGRVAWGEIWGSFCDLAMAGGPPHKGRLLEPGSAAEIKEHPSEYRAVVEEITRGIRLASDVAVGKSKRPGWVCVDCDDSTMAEWLLRAVTMENISCQCEGNLLYLPAGPQYRIEKEIKNVITSIAKTTHYWSGHMWRAQKEEIRKSFARMNAEQPLVQPAVIGVDCTPKEYAAFLRKAIDEITANARLLLSDRKYSGWLGVKCPNVAAAVWMMRLLVPMNVLSRREDHDLFVAANPAADPEGQAVVKSLERVFRFARAKSIIAPVDNNSL